MIEPMSYMKLSVKTLREGTVRNVMQICLWKCDLYILRLKEI